MEENNSKTTNKSKNVRRKWIIVVIIIAVIALIAVSCADFITDLIWFGEVGYTSVFLTELFTKIKIGIPVAIISAGISVLILSALKKNFLKKNNFSLTSEDDKRTVRRVRNVLSIILGVFLAVVTVSKLWFQMLEFFNYSSFGVKDPLFGNDVGFYMFRYEFLTGLADSALLIIVAFLIATVLFHSILVGIARPAGTEEKTETERPGIEIDPTDPLGSIFRGISDKAGDVREGAAKSGFVRKAKAVLSVALKEVVVLGVLLFLALAAKLYLSRFGLLYGGTGAAYGAGYTDVKVTLNVYRILIVLAVVEAVLLIFAAIRKKFLFAVIVPVAMIAISLLGTGAAKLVQTIIVEPNELNKESKYLENNLTYTRLAYDLEDISDEVFDPQADLDIKDVLRNMGTLSNLRINDFAPTKQFYTQTQSIRRYYTFNDVDVDRYNINDEYTQVFLSAREIDSASVDDSWLIRHLKYTHGYGLTLSRVDRVTSSGQPEMLIQSIPPVSQIPEVQISRPEIYYGEMSNDYIIVKTGETEFDYPSGDSNVYTTYEGDGGIKLGLASRILFSIREKSLKLLVSTNITHDSRIMIYRNIMDRVRKIAPFLTYDDDPYVVTVDGGIYWIVDAYTQSTLYPYSEPYDKKYDTNYVRNSVKIIIDAYNGNVDFYIVDEDDPIVQTLSKIYPKLFKSFDQMPQSFRAHLQYPNALFNIQAGVYAKYHMTDVAVFYQKEDAWQISKNIYDQSEMTMTANFFIMKLPGEQDTEFVSSVSYTPAGKNNLTGILVARSDGEHYGDIVLYQMPKGRLIYGPLQVEAKIDQDPEISKEFTLWNNSGSKYSRGEMFVIPIEDSLIYVEPVYLESSTASLPEVKRVIVYYDEQLAYAPTLAEALDMLFGEGAGDPLLTPYPIITGKEMADEIERKEQEEQNPPEPVDPEPVDPDQPGEHTIEELADLAQQAFEKAQEALKNLDWASYGQYMQQLQDLLNQMKKMSGVEGE
ncbi:MAG: UPF0182 family protein [Firmicutes bacterium]|nr:UPF0182 family protein [Bacillota bacterium]